jgi:hypothetical protein
MPAQNINVRWGVFLLRKHTDNRIYDIEKMKRKEALRLLKKILCGEKRQ